MTGKHRNSSTLKPFTIVVLKPKGNSVLPVLRKSKEGQASGVELVMDSLISVFQTVAWGAHEGGGRSHELS